MGSHTLKQLKCYSFDEIKNLFETKIRRVHTFAPMKSESEKVIPELAAGSSKRDAEEELVQESSKRQKTRESSEPIEEPKDKEEEELSQERIQQMMIIVLEQGMNVEALQTKYPRIDWEIYIEGARKYWKIIRVGNHTEVYQFFDDMLKSFDREDLVKLWNTNDELWKTKKHIHYVTWRLYDTCGVHHVSTKDEVDIYMLVEREYPLLRGVLTQMLVASLLVEQDSKMSRELLKKIFMQIGFNSTIELVSFDETQVVTFNGKFICGIRNGDYKTRIQSDNRVGILHGQLSVVEVDRFFIQMEIFCFMDEVFDSEYVQVPTDGVGDAIVVPPILANQFELKIGLLNLVTAIAFHGFENDDPRYHIRRFTKITQTVKLNNVSSDVVKLLLFLFALEGAARTWLEKEPPNSITTWNDLVSKFVNRFFPPFKTTNLRNEITRFQQRFGETFAESWDRFKDLLNKCSHHGFSPLHQIDSFYNSLNQSEQESLTSAAGSNFLTKNTQEALTIIKNKSKVQTSRNKPKVASASGSSTQDAYITSLTKQVEALRSLHRPVNSV
ncbi:reverse transcriptase domain-containing protein [Tanacetum coccineum]